MYLYLSFACALPSCLFQQGVDEFVIVDCRYPFEYEGGHAGGSYNLWTMPILESFLFEQNIRELVSANSRRFHQPQLGQCTQAGPHPLNRLRGFCGSERAGEYTGGYSAYACVVLVKYFSLRGLCSSSNRE